MRQVLALMLYHLGDRRICTTYFDSTNAPFDTFLKTTWIELHERHYIASLFRGMPTYKLTKWGYARGLKEANALGEPHFKARLGKIASVLKNSVKGRTQAALVSVETIVRESNLDDGFVYNALEANLLEEVLGIHGTAWPQGFEGRLVVVPITFGQEKLVF